MNNSALFHANVSRIRSIDADAAREIEDFSEGASSVSITSHPTGNFIVCETNGSETHYPVHDRESGSYHLPIIQEFEQGAWVVVCIGLGFGYELRPVLRYLAETQMEAATGLWIIEPRVDLLRAACGAVDLSGLLGSERCVFTLGSAAIEKTAKTVEESGFSTLAENRIRFQAGCGVATLRQNGWIAKCRQNILESWQAKSKIFLRQFDAARVKYSDKTNPGIKTVWSQVSEEKHAGHITPYLTNAMANGFSLLGLESRMFVVQRQSFTQLYRATRHFHEVPPDLMFSVNAPSTRSARFADGYSFPRVIWLVDHPSLQSYQAAYHPSDYVVSLCDDFAEPSLRASSRYLGVMNGAVDESQTPGHAVSALKATVCYVGSLPNIDGMRQAVPASVWDFIERLAEGLLSQTLNGFDVFGENPPPPGIESLAKLHPETRAMPCDYLTRWSALHAAYLLANYKKRTAAARVVAEFGGKVYGSSAWLGFCRGIGKEEMFGGEVGGREMLADVYASSSINLSINAAQPGLFINPRVFEAPVMGGFLMGDYCPMVDEVFPAAMNNLWFHGEDELRHRIQHFLDHPDERKELLEIHKAELLAQHTFKHRAQELLRKISKEQSKNCEGSKNYE